MRGRSTAQAVRGGHEGHPRLRRQAASHLPRGADRLSGRARPDGTGRGRSAQSAGPSPPSAPLARANLGRNNLGRNPSFSAPFAPEAVCKRTLWDGMEGSHRGKFRHLLPSAAASGLSPLKTDPIPKQVDGESGFGAMQPHPASSAHISSILPIRIILLLLGSSRESLLRPFFAAGVARRL
jgi:hypothetical protein